jgi:hypothetical protein
MLSLVLAASANAGTIHTTIATPPGDTSATTEGDIHTGVAGEITTMNADAVGSSVTEAALSLIESVLSLF